jgi:FAD/FMN-containing dehydrogenase
VTRRRASLLTRGSFLAAAGISTLGLHVYSAQARTAQLPSDAVKPGDPGYDGARQDENARLDFRPAVIAYCRSTDDVSSSVRWGAQKGLAIAVRSGGHDYEGFSLNNGGLVVDVSRYSGVFISSDGKTATVRAGTRMNTLYNELRKAGLTLPGGASGTVGVGGLTTGGGYGLMVRRHSLMCDRLRRVKMVDSKGRLRDSAADDMSDEIVWAARGGGGGSFGVVTDFEFELVPTPTEVAYYSILWPWDDELAETLLSRWFGWSGEAPRELSSVLTLAGGSPKTIRSSGLFLGEAEMLTPMLHEFVGSSSPRRFYAASLSYLDAMRTIMGGTSARQSWKMKSSFGSHPLSCEGIKAAVRQFTRMPSKATCVLEFDSFGGGVNEISPEATAFPHRNMSYLLQYQVYWNDPAAARQSFGWIREAFAAIDPYTSAKSYRNYCDLDLADWQTRYFSGNYARLQDIKARLDPGNLFRFPQSIGLPERSARKALEIPHA